MKLFKKHRSTPVTFSPVQTPRSGYTLLERLPDIRRIIRDSDGGPRGERVSRRRRHRDHEASLRPRKLHFGNVEEDIAEVFRPSPDTPANFFLVSPLDMDVEKEEEKQEKQENQEKKDGPSRLSSSSPREFICRDNHTGFCVSKAKRKMPASLSSGVCLLVLMGVVSMYMGIVFYYVVFESTIVPDAVSFAFNVTFVIFVTIHLMLILDQLQVVRENLDRRESTSRQISNLFSTPVPLTTPAMAAGPSKSVAV